MAAEMTREQFEAAKARGDARMRGPRAERARYDVAHGMLFVRLTTGFEFGFFPDQVEGLRGAVPEALAEVEVEEFGLGLHWEALDADVYLPALLEGVVGSKRWMAQELGAAGGRARSYAKAASSRENGKLGGRPPKTPGVER